MHDRQPRDRWTIRPTRRHLLGGGVVTAGALLLDTIGRPRCVWADPDAAIPARHVYLVSDSGSLTIQVDSTEDDSTASDWTAIATAPPFPGGLDWAAFSFVFAGGDGVIYAVDGAGDLFYFRLLDPWRNPTAGWSPDSGRRIGRGFYPRDWKCLTGGGDGIVYGLKHDDDLWYFRHGWAAGGEVVAAWQQTVIHRWPDTVSILGCGDGLLYRIQQNEEAPFGQLSWHAQGRVAVADAWSYYGRGSRVIGDGFGTGRFARTFAGGHGVIYGVQADGGLYRYRDRDQQGRSSWAHGGVGLRIGEGFLAGYKFVFAASSAHRIEGYVSTAAAGSTLSLRPGDAVSCRVSTFARGYSARVVRLRRQPGATAALELDQQAPPVTAPARDSGTYKKPYHTDMWTTGAGWPSDGVQLTLPASAPSGLYAVELTSPTGGRSYAPFVVKPRSPPAAGTARDLLVLANVHTWNAYNTWGGASRYSNPVEAALNHLSYERPLQTSALELTDALARPPSHLARAESWVTDWLDREGRSFDVYSDVDLHAMTLDVLRRYRAILLHTHPEYWTTTMYDKVQAYLNAGGHLIYVGGNACYEKVDIQPDGRMSVSPVATRRLFRDLGRPERALLGIAYETAPFASSGAYTVVEPDHPFMAGRASFGASAGLNFDMRAATWEVDQTGPATPAGTVVLARSLFGGNLSEGVHFTVGPADRRGWVFSIGSIGFGGCLAVDPDLQAVVRRAIDQALANPPPV